MSAPHHFDATLLREYDIRGVVGKTLFAADALAIGRSFGTTVRRAGGTKVAIGYDGRLSSPEMEAAVVEGLLACGLDVTRIGLGATPMLYYAVNELDLDGGIMITGSHNPPDYNGFKMMIGKKPLYGDGIRALGGLAAAADYEDGHGVQRSIELLDRYVARLHRDFKPGRALTVVWDSGNGSAGPAMVELVKHLPGRHVLINAEVDGTFPNHHPDPTDEHTLEQLKAKVAAEQADLGIAFDGDGDRIGVIDGRVRVLWGDQILSLLARPVLAERPGAVIIADVKASRGLFDEVARLGGKPLMWKTGHSLIKVKMAETGSPLAGEMSGHVFFADRWYGFDDALYAAVRVLELVGAQALTVAALRDELPSFVATPELRFPCSEERKFAVVEEARARLSASGAEVSAVDGVRVTTADGWWLLRASNTQDVLVARCEAYDAPGLTRLKAALVDTLGQSGVTIPNFT